MKNNFEIREINTLSNISIPSLRNKKVTGVVKYYYDDYCEESTNEVYYDDNGLAKIYKYLDTGITETCIRDSKYRLKKKITKFNNGSELVKDIAHLNDDCFIKDNKFVGADEFIYTFDENNRIIYYSECGVNFSISYDNKDRITSIYTNYLTDEEVCFKSLYISYIGDNIKNYIVDGNILLNDTDYDLVINTIGDMENVNKNTILKQINNLLEEINNDINYITNEGLESVLYMNGEPILTISDTDFDCYVNGECIVSNNSKFIIKFKEVNGNIVNIEGYTKIDNKLILQYEEKIKIETNI